MGHFSVTILTSTGSVLSDIQQTYNYEGFEALGYDLDQFTGPIPGTRAPDFALTKADGQAHQLLDFEADFLVLELGSITCPLFQSRRRSMVKTAAKAANADFAVLYVREAHPGTAIPAHHAIRQRAPHKLLLERCQLDQFASLWTLRDCQRFEEPDCFRGCLHASISKDFSFAR